MEKQNKVFIATSLDGFIADRDGEVDWLHAIPNPDQSDMGYAQFMSGVDALIMGRTTFETVCGFDVDWPYEKPVFVLSNRMQNVPKEYEGKAEVVSGPLKDVLSSIHQRGYNRLYIDGGRTIQSFLNQDLVNEMIITIIPCLLGGGISLFSELPERLNFECVDSRVFKGGVVQNHFVRKD